LGAGSGLGAVLFDEPSQMILRAAKVETEQKKILKYTNAKGEVSWRGRKEKAGLYRRGSAPETNAALSVTPSLLLSSLFSLALLFLFILRAPRRSVRERFEPTQDMEGRAPDVEQVGWGHKWN